MQLFGFSPPARALRDFATKGKGFSERLLVCVLFCLVYSMQHNQGWQDSASRSKKPRQKGLALCLVPCALAAPTATQPDPFRGSGGSCQEGVCSRLVRWVI